MTKQSKTAKYIRIFLFLWLAAYAGVFIFRSLATEAEVPLLAEVHTWGELIAQKPVVLRKPTNLINRVQPSCKIGIDRTRAERYGEIVLYCLTQSDPALLKSGGNEKLGPFWVWVKAPVESVRKDAISSLQSAESKRAGSILLFMKTIPLSQAGEYEITMEEALDDTKDMQFHTVAATKVKVSGTAGTLWSPWEQPQPVKVASQKSEPDNFRLMDVTNPSGGTALPKWDGWMPVAVEKLPEAKLPLPAPLPEAPDAGVQLSIEGTHLVVKLDEAFSTCFPEDNFLTRWWVNGKPFVPKPEIEALDSQAWSGDVPSSKEFHFRMEFHPEYLHAKKGDVVGVQLLFCPVGWEYCSSVDGAAPKKIPQDLPDGRVMAEDIRISRMSNQIEFVYTGNAAAFAGKSGVRVQK